MRKELEMDLQKELGKFKQCKWCNGSGDDGGGYNACPDCESTGLEGGRSAVDVMNELENLYIRRCEIEYEKKNKESKWKMKPKAKESMLKELTKALANDATISIDINLQLLSDKELKNLYLILQDLRSGKVPYAVPKKQDFIEVMKNGELQYVSFRDTFKLLKSEIRPLTFKEFLLLREFVKENPQMYKALNLI